MNVLTRCTLYRITSFEPTFMRYVEEGNIAYYGLILQSEFNKVIQDYLLRNSRDGLWEYHHGYGVTAADSALVIEGLLESGVEPSILKPSIEKLFDLYYSQEHGAFKTVVQGRAAYWSGVSTETTAHVAYLALRIAPELHPGKIERCAEYIRQAQDSQGFWRGRWFPSLLIPTYYSMRFLHRMDDSYSESLAHARDWIIAQQQPDGSWSGSVIDSAAAILALTTVSECADAVEKARQWILEQKKGAGWSGETVIYYWFEESAYKLFYCCQDKGQITTAWAQLAISAAAQ